MSARVIVFSVLMLVSFAAFASKSPAPAAVEKPVSEAAVATAPTSESLVANPDQDCDGVACTKKDDDCDGVACPKPACVGADCPASSDQPVPSGMAINEKGLPGEKGTKKKTK